MRHASSRYQSRSGDKFPAKESCRNRNERMTSEERHLHKLKKHKKRYKDLNKPEREHEIPKRNYEEVVEIHGSSSEEDQARLSSSKHRNTHRKKHRRHCSEHRKKHKERSSKEEPVSYSEDEDVPQLPEVKKEPDSDDEEVTIQRDRSEQHGKKSRSSSDHGNSDTNSLIKNEPRDETGVDDQMRSRRSHERRDNRKSRFGSTNREHKWGKNDSSNSAGTSGGTAPAGSKQKPNFELSGKLAEDTNTFNGVVVKYSEPPEARKPKRRWRLYPFKGDTSLPPLYIHRQSAYLLGRDRKVADIPIDHPSCSKQHAALQYRLVPFKRENGTTGKQIKLYIIDLESANGTFINNKQIECKKYVELIERDVIKFGFSSREYVLLHEHSKDEDGEVDDDDVRPN